MNVTKEEAQVAIEVAKLYLAQQRAAWETAGKPSRDGDPPHWNTAAAWADALLEASERDGLCGCPLCRS